MNEALLSLSSEKSDILIIDDGSNTDYTNWGNVNVIQKKKGKGLTDSWNIGYRYFKDNGYDRCVLSNDDVIFPNRVPNDMWTGLYRYTFIGPLSDPIGSGRFMGNFQNIDTYLRRIPDYKDVISINQRLQKKNPNKRFLEINKDITLQREEPPYINGFCFSFDKKIIDYEYSKDVLFNPSKINTGNEKELQRYRVLDGKVISIKSYVFHYKSQSFKNNREEVVNL